MTVETLAAKGKLTTFQAGGIPMNDNQQKKPNPDAGLEDEEPIDPHHIEEAEIVRSGSQTAQDRDHTIRGGDDRTAPMKEFPT